MFDQLKNFVWGENGEMLTPDQVARKRELADIARGRMGDTSPVAHWSQGATRVVDALGGVMNERRADRGQEAGMASAEDYVANDSVLSRLLGGGSGSVSSMSNDVTPFTSSGAAQETQGTPEMASFMDSDNPLRQGILETARAIGADPLDLATAISYETAGTFSPTQAGPTTQWGQHRGLIQFGEPQAQQHGVDWDNPLASQLGGDGAVANYFRSSGFEPGMSGLDLYSTINAGAPGLHGRTDENNGGAPGSVADKWNNQMSGHREKAMALLGGEYTPPAGGGMSPQGQPMPMTGGGSGVTAALAAGMSNPWVAERYGPVIESLMGQEQRRGDMQFEQQMRQSDPMYQAQLRDLNAPDVVDPMDAIRLETARLELDQMRNPQAPPPGAPTTQKIFDPATGREQVVQWNPAANDWVPLGGVEAESGPMVNVENNMPGADKFAEAFASGDAASLATISESGMSAQRNMSRINQLESLLSESPSGMAGVIALKAGEWGVNTDGLNELQAAQALISALVPEQRQPGSGPMSDADLDLFKQSLPRIINQPGGNAMILNTMRSIAQYDADGAAIVQRLRAGELTRAQAFSELQGRPNPMQNFTAPNQQAGGDPAGVSDADLLLQYGGN